MECGFFKYSSKLLSFPLYSENRYSDRIQIQFQSYSFNFSKPSGCAVVMAAGEPEPTVNHSLGLMLCSPIGINVFQTVRYCYFALKLNSLGYSLHLFFLIFQILIYFAALGDQYKTYISAALGVIIVSSQDFLESST